MEEGNHQALYRRYRSTSFDELIGQEHVTDILKSAVMRGQISHAYLFTGQRGTGKTSAARILAYAINDLPYKAGENHLDIIEIDAASNRRIDDIRDLREKVYIAPVSAKYKVYIIDEVHMLTGESFNALLKTIEEPPTHAVFILATTELHKVPATIVSRTQRFHFRPVAKTRVAEHLRSMASQEGIRITDDALSLIAEHGGGSFRDSISLLDQLAGLGEEITADTVESILGRARTHEIHELVAALQRNDRSTLHTLLNHMLEQGASPVTLSEQLVAALLGSNHTERRWYELTEKLLGIPKSHFPDLLLMNTLFGFMALDSPEAPTGIDASTSKPAEKKRLAAPKIITPKPIPEPVEISQPAAEDQVPAETPARENEPDQFDWKKILTAVKKSNPALHAVLGRATHTYADHQLTLSFQYALHRKKLEQPQYLQQLSRAIQDVCNLNPHILVEGTTPQLATDDTSKRVADLMGGGESVTV